jgi:hypothetical protein
MHSNKAPSTKWKTLKLSNGWPPGHPRDNIKQNRKQEGHFPCHSHTLNKDIIGQTKTGPSTQYQTSAKASLPCSDNWNPTHSLVSPMPIKRRASEHHPPSNYPPSNHQNMNLPEILPRTLECIQPSQPKMKSPSKPKQVQSTLLNQFSCKLTQNMDDTTGGHTMEPIDNLSIFWILFQNPNGININNKAFQYRCGLSTCKSHNIAAITIAETKLNTNQHKVLATLKGVHSEDFSNSSFQTSQTPDKFTREFQPGGTLTLLCKNWSSRVIEKGPTHTA